MADNDQRLFSPTHRRYWLPVTGGMILIGVVNVVLGLVCTPDEPPPESNAILPTIPPPSALSQPAALRPTAPVQNP